MRKFLFIIAVAILGFLLSPQANAQKLTAEEKAWIAAVQPFAAHAASIGVPVAIGVATEAGDNASPAGMSYNDGVCTFIIAARGNRTARTLTALAASPEQARLFVVAHEYGHCMHNAAVAGGAKLPPVASQIAEAMADVFAVAWVAQNCPDAMQASLEFFRKLRTMDASGDYAKSLKALDVIAATRIDSSASPLEYANHIGKNL